MRKILALILLAILLMAAVPHFTVGAYAQQSNYPSGGQIVGGFATNRSTKNSSVTIATSGTFQVLLVSTMISNITVRQALTIENNNPSGANCWIFLGSGTAAVSNSILLPVAGAYTRYWPFVPSDQIQGTCGANGSTIYVDVQ